MSVNSLEKENHLTFPITSMSKGLEQRNKIVYILGVMFGIYRKNKC